MPRRLPPHLEIWQDRHGKTRVYFRRGKGPRVALPNDVTSDEFKLAYAEALAGNVVDRRARRERAEPGSLGALILSYQQSAAYVELRATTRTTYARRLESIREAHAHRSVAGMTREAIVTKIMQPYAGRPGAAINVLKMLRILIRHAIETGLLRHDPSIAIKRPKGGEIRSWTDQEIAQFESRWPIGSKQRLAFALHLYSGQRRSDVHRMTWADFDGNTIRVVQQKTREKLAIPVHSELRRILDAAPRAHVVIVSTEFGKPFTVDGYSRFMRDAIAAAGLPLDAQPHGLRKAAGRRLAESGASAKEIMSVLGHKSLIECERYTRQADQEKLATAAILKLEGRKANKGSQTVRKSLGRRRESKGEAKC